MNTIVFILKIAACILTADFITGLVHFMLDRYGSPDTPIVGKLIYERNARHHQNPREMIKNSYFRLTWTSWALGFILVGLCYFTGILRWEIVFLLAYGANANVIHKWTHQSDKENGAFIKFLQKTKWVQSRKHHGWHHKAPYDVNYCILTDVLNPVLDKTRFWEGLSWGLESIGLKRVQA
jgi:plasmanylethanolamine desaturase